ncbi:hypothetical protein RIF29_28021 [Crotalaria pallida]|uniref:Uncharacterized protein n=1 Tax=Crotalaria pallida TaxID=3830 RepID=A0AAN9EQ64_CROPI
MMQIREQVQIGEMKRRGNRRGRTRCCRRPNCVAATIHDVAAAVEFCRVVVLECGDWVLRDVWRGKLLLLKYLVLFLITRFARIKKIMQADEDVGKIAMVVLFGYFKALFLIRWVACTLPLAGSSVLNQHDKHTRSNESLENVTDPDEVKQNLPVSKPVEVSIRNFDLNMEPDENMDSLAVSIPTPPVPSNLPAKSVSQEKHEEYPGWSLSDVDKMAIDPMQLANLNRNINEDTEDYDEET